MSSRRSPLTRAGFNEPKAGSHAGLWLDRFILAQEREDKTSRSALIEQTSGIRAHSHYAAFFRRWRDSLQKMGARCCEAEVIGRLALGMGNESVLETSISLHRAYGVPLIPGSALKGLAASFARHHLGEEWNAEGEAYTTLFGATDMGGYVTFFDALLVPGSGKAGQALHADVLTVHHQDYYGGGAKPPADWDGPNPVPFLSASGKYLLALAAPAGCEEWVSTGFSILKHALEHSGVGAKTSSGYGRLRMNIDNSVRESENPGDRQAEVMMERLRRLSARDVAPHIGGYYDKWKKEPMSDAAKRKLAQAIVDKVQEAGYDKRWAHKPWYQELLASLAEK